MRLQRLLATLNIMQNMESPLLTSSSLQANFSWKLLIQIFQLVVWWIYIKAYVEQCSEKLNSGRDEVMLLYSITLFFHLYVSKKGCLILEDYLAEHSIIKLFAKEFYFLP